MNKIERLQRQLIELGYDPGPVDGMFGDRTFGTIEVALCEISGYRLLDSPPKATSIEEPKWLTYARTQIGQKEIAGPRHNPDIVDYWDGIELDVDNDEVPWCAAFVNSCLAKDGIKGTGKPSARSYLNWGFETPVPVLGCIVVFWRGSPGGWKGHVGFVVGKNDSGRLLVLGGNQKNSVSIQAFDTSRVLSFRLPKCVLQAEFEPLPILDIESELSKNEE